MSTARENSVKQLSELYNVVIGIALSLAIYNTIDKTAAPIPLKFDTLPNFFTVLVLIVPFYHGAVRHLFATYVEKGGSTRIKSGALLADFFLLFIEGCVFVIMASVVSSTITLGWVIVGLLVLDSVWGFLAWLAFTGAQAQFAERKWALINVITAAFLTLGLIFLGDRVQDIPTGFQFALLIVASIRTLSDYVFTWDFYFPSDETTST